MDEEPVSSCCAVPLGEYLDYMICPQCKEHCDLIDENGEIIE